MAGMRILGWGSAHGEQVVTNSDMTEYVNTSDEWIRSKTGIEQRYFAKRKTNADMATEAAQNALAKMQEQRVADDSPVTEAEPEIDAVIVATFTPDRATPSVAAEVAGNLGMEEKLMTLDVNSACSGFVYGLILANALLRTGFQRILLIGSERIHPLMDMKDRRTCVLFGDAAGAVVLEQDKSGEFYHVEGSLPNLDVIQCDRFDPAIKMAGQEVYRFAVSMVPECGESLLDQAGMDADDVDMFLFHQANQRIIDSASRKMGIPERKCFVNVDRYGNTSAASIAVALSECLERKEITRGSRVLTVGFGAGLSYGGVLMTI